MKIIHTWSDFWWMRFGPRIFQRLEETSNFTTGCPLQKWTNLNSGFALERITSIRICLSPQKCHSRGGIPQNWCFNFNGENVGNIRANKQRMPKRSLYLAHPNYVHWSFFPCVWPHLAKAWDIFNHCPLCEASRSSSVLWPFNRGSEVLQRPHWLQSPWTLGSKDSWRKNALLKAGELVTIYIHRLL